MKRYFVTGTDTDCGKTLVTTALLEKANQLGLSTLGLKPIAAGCEIEGDELTNSDARMIRQTMNIALDYASINPIALEPPIAPHIAAARLGIDLRLKDLIQKMEKGLSIQADLCLIEGAGGWLVPINANEFLSDLCIELELPVVFVVGMKLGCINHALLTLECIRGRGVTIAGWVANQIDSEMSCFDENLETLKEKIPDKFLGTIPWIDAKEPEQRVKKAASFIDLP